MHEKKKVIELTQKELKKITGGLVKEKVDPADDDKLYGDWNDLDDGVTHKKARRKKARRKLTWFGGV